MTLDVKLSGLEALLSRMGAKRKLWIPDQILASIRQTQKLLEEGIVTSLSEIEVTNGGLLSCQGQQMAVYIRDHTNNYLNRRSVLENAEHGNRIHIFDCQKLHEMRRDNRYARYVQTTRTSSFEIDVKISGQSVKRNADLKVCKLCLKALKYNGYTGSNNNLWENFNLKTFFSEYSTFFAIPAMYNDFAAPNPDYVKNWSLISNRIRKNARWICQNQNCSCNLSEDKYRQYLHVHHKNGIKSSNTSNNLIALCALCHSKEPHHQHMNVPDKVRKIILEQRPPQKMLNHHSSSKPQ